MKFLRKIAVALVLGAAAMQPARAHEHFFDVQLTGVSGSPATGTAVVLLDLDLISMNISGSFSGLAGPATSIHLHCCTTLPGVGLAGEATTAIGSPPGFPLGATAGTLAIVDFDLTTGAAYVPAFVTVSGGTISDALNALTFGSFDSKAYLSIASAAFPNGELVGFLVEQAAPVPEPGAAVLLLAGLAAVGTLARRRP